MDYSTAADHEPLLLIDNANTDTSMMTATDEQEHGASLGVWIGLILIATASFWSQATVTEERFVPALNVISFAFQIPDDIAGATLMAAGASSPELFSSFVALFITHSSLGLGTVFGSEVFNQLIICAGAVYSSRTGQLQLNRAIFSREVFFYALGIVALYLALQNVGPLDENDHENNDENGNEETTSDSTINHIFISFGQACLVFGGYVFYVMVCANMDAVVKFFSKLRGGDQDDSSASSKRTDSKSSAHYASINVEEDLPFLLEKQASRFFGREPVGNFDTAEYHSTYTGHRSRSIHNDTNPNNNLDYNNSEVPALRRPESPFDEGADGETSPLLQNMPQGLTKFSDGASTRPFHFLVSTEKPSDEHKLYDIEENTYEERLSCFMFQRSYFYDKAYFAKKGWHLRWFSFLPDKMVSVPDRAQYDRHRITYPPFTQVVVDPDRHLIKLMDKNTTTVSDASNKACSFIFMAPSQEVLDKVIHRLNDLAQMYQQKVEAKLAAAAAQKEVGLDVPAAASTFSDDVTSDRETAENDVHDFESIIAIPVGASIWGWIWFLWLFPLRLLIHWTIPDVRTSDKHGNPNSSLAMACISCTMCLVWLVVGSYAMVASLEALAELLDIPDAVIGYTVSAAGTSLPNYVASAVAARNGFGNMAVSNALGSNTFNIMIGLGLPWVLYTSFGTHFGPYNELKDEGITEGVLIMAAILLLLVLLLLQSGFVLYIWHGHLFVVTYIAYLVYVIGGVYWK